MTRLAATVLRNDLSDTLNRVAYGRERIVLHRRGKNLAVLIPIEDFKFLEEIEDAKDVDEAIRRLDDPNEKPVSYRKAKKVLGLK